MRSIVVAIAFAMIASALRSLPSAQQPSTVKVGLSVPAGAITRTGLVGIADSLRSERLGALGEDGRVNPRLAKSWTRSQDGRQWTFTIADDVRFHSGKPADAQIIARLLKIAVTAPVELRTHPGLAEIEDIAPIDQRRFVLRNSTSRITILDELAELSLGEGGEDFATGPFRIAAFTESGFSGEAFRQYFRGRPGIDRVQFTVFRSLRAAWAALMRDEIDVMYEVGRDSAEFVNKDSRVRTYPFLRPYAATLFLNVASPRLRDPRIRQALTLSVDRRSVVGTAFRGRGRIADGPLWPQHWAVHDVPRVAGYDPVRAAELLRTAGPGRGPDGFALKFRCLVAAGVETQPFERIALILQKQLFDIGIDMQLELVSPREFLARTSSGHFDSALFEFVALTPSWVSAFWHSPAPDGQVWVRHNYSAADKELEAMQMASHEDELKRAVAAVYQKMTVDPPAIFIAWPEVARAVSTRFEVPVEKGRDIMGGNLWLWRPAKRAEQ